MGGCQVSPTDPFVKFPHAPRMSNQHGGVGGAVVQVSSVLGLFASHRQPKGWAYNVSKSAVVTLSRCLGSSTSWQSSTGVRSLCLCPSVARTPILDGCSEEELARMRRDVGGIMDKEQVHCKCCFGLN